MHFLISWLVTTGIIYGLSELGFLIKVPSFQAAMSVSFYFALFYILLRLVAFALKMTACLTLGLGYLVGIVIQLIAYPLALVNAAERSLGVSEVTFAQAVLLSILIVSVRDSILLRLERTRKIKKTIF